MGDFKNQLSKNLILDLVRSLENRIEELANEVHQAWWKEKVKQGYHAPLIGHPKIGDRLKKSCPLCHMDMYPYAELDEGVKEYDRVTVRAVLGAIKKVVRKG